MKPANGRQQTKRNHNLTFDSTAGFLMVVFIMNALRTGVTLAYHGDVVFGLLWQHDALLSVTV